MEEERYKTETGEEKAWRELGMADPELVAANSGAVYDPASRTYELAILGGRYLIVPAARKITNLGHPDKAPEYFLDLSTPLYLLGARPVPPSGSYVKELPGGEFFFRGSHTLPLGAVAEKYASDKAGFERACREALGGVPERMGDAACSFLVYPRVRMAFVLWLSDEEFEARANLLFDSNCGLHMALDVVWAVALLACQRLLKHGG